MAQATLTITMPERNWVGQLSTAYPEATFQVLAALGDAESGFALVRITESNRSQVLEDVRDHPQITAFTLLQRRDNAATVHVETAESLAPFSSGGSELPLEFPLEIVDGETTIEVTGTRDHLAGLAEQLEYSPVDYRIDEVHERLHESQLLSERQLEIVVTAVEEGYYDTPRRSSLTELAAHLGIAKSTCSETLHRAEGSIIKRFVDDVSQNDADDELKEHFATR